MFTPPRYLAALIVGASLFGVVGVPAASAAAVVFINRAAFLADPAVTSTTSIDFDTSAPGTDLTGSTLSGATFSAPGASPLQVILGSTGVRNPMSPSSGANVLSPGGSDTSQENDDLRIDFATPVRAAGLDVVFDAPDGASYVGVSFFDASGALLGGSGFIPAPIGAPGFQFIGLVSDSANIAAMVFDEFDGSAADDHVAYDSVIFSPAAAVPPVHGTPLPGSVLLLGLGWIGLGFARRRLV